MVFAREGVAVVCPDVKKSAREEGYEKDIQTDTEDVILQEDGQAEDLDCDVTKASDVQAVVDGAIFALGRLEVMVNNAGVFAGLHTIVDETEEQYDFTMVVNVKSVWLGCKFAIAQMLKQEDNGGGQTSRGKIINIASIGGLVGLAAEPAYCASKGAVVNLTRQLAVNYAPERINVNAI